MPDRFIPLIDCRHLPSPGLPSSLDSSAAQATPALSWIDPLGRPLRDLRISVTDRCNFRCGYCMPKAVFDRDHAFLPHSALLSFEEITRLANVFAAHGVTKLRLTGGEPLLRRNLEQLVAMLSQVTTPEGAPLDLTLTTNGSILSRKAQALKAAGLHRVTVSLDALDDAIFRQMNDVDFPVADVLAGIHAARDVGLGPIKVNMVVKRGTNDHQILPMARFFRDELPGVVLRFIEFMDVGETNGWRREEVLPSDEVIRRLDDAYGVTPLEANAPGETAQRWAWRDGRGEIGVISSVTRAFCRDCNRARLSTDGKLFSCLFAHQGYDLRQRLRQGDSDAALAAAVGTVWRQRNDQYSLLRTQGSPPLRVSAPGARIEMSYIGG